MSRLLKTTTAALLLSVVGYSGAAVAADLGGNCCADLEERIAELEATTVRKGNRKVSLQISGHIGHQVLFWNDGRQSDMYIGDGGNIFSRFRLKGEAKISPDLTAGFTYEFGINNNNIGAMNQLNGGDDLGGSTAPELRDSTVWLRHKQYGMLKIGHGSTATDNLVLIDLGGMSSASTPDLPLYIGGFFNVNPSGTATATDGVGVVGITQGQMMLGGRESWDTVRRNHVLYETPTLAGFSVQAAVAEDNFWDVALRYAGEFNGIRIAFGIGYREDTEFNAGNQLLNQAGALCSSRCDEKEKVFLGSASVLHVPTGLFVTGAAGTRKLENGILLGSWDNRNATADFFYVAGGISQNYFGFGKTVLFGEYSQHNDALRFLFSDVVDSKTTHWGVGLTQHIDAAAMELFITYKRFENEFNRNNGTLAAPVFGHVVFRDTDAIIAGTRINF